MQQCVTCGGTYAPTLPDGTEYYHVCPPLSVPELKTAIAAGRLVFSPADQARLADAEKADAALVAASQPPTAVDAFLRTFTIARPNARNENVVGITPLTGDPVIVSAGGGVRPVVVPPPSPPTLLG